MTKARAILCAALFVALCAPARSQTNTITVATASGDSAAEVYYARDMGFFAKEGLDVRIQPGANGSAMASAVPPTRYDIGYSDLVTLAKAYLEGIPFVTIASAALWASTKPNAGLVVLPRSPITTAKDLTGKIVAVPGLATLAEYSPRAWIDQAGGDSASVKFIELPFAAMPGALSAGRIDTAYLSGPFLATIENQIRVLDYTHDAAAKRFLQSACFTTPRWANAHPGLVRRFAAAIAETAAWANHNPAGNRCQREVRRLPAVPC